VFQHRKNAVVGNDGAAAGKVRITAWQSHGQEYNEWAVTTLHGAHFFDHTPSGLGFLEATVGISIRVGSGNLEACQSKTFLPGQGVLFL
jgi:hypothetical protein